MGYRWVQPLCSVVFLTASAACSSGGKPADITVASQPDITDPTDTDNGNDDPIISTPVVDPLSIVAAAERDYFMSITLPDIQNAISTANAGITTPFASLTPTAGAVTYSGYMTLSVVTSSVGANLSGQATLNADFSTNTVTGSAFNFHEPITVRDGAAIPLEVVSYDGTLEITGGVIGSNTSGGATIDVNIHGSLSDGVKTITLESQMEGSFYGANAEGLKVISGSSSGGAISADIDGQIAIIATAGIYAQK